LRRWVLAQPIVSCVLQLEPAWRFVTDDCSTAAPARASFTTYLQRRGLADTAIDAAELIFGELVSNVVRHAPGPIEVEVFWDDAGCRLIVRDRGPGFVPNPGMPDPYAESGRGLFMITLFGGLTSVSRRAGGGSEVTVVFAPAAAVTLT
jgi:anti-sigma regulatory factor (Ser/Thr protein kinase)